MNEILLGTIDFEPVITEDFLGNPIPKSSAKLYIYSGEGYSDPHFHICFGPNDAHRKQDRSKRGTQTCIHIFDASYFRHESNNSDTLSLVGRETNDLNKFMDKPCTILNKFPQIPINWIIDPTDKKSDPNNLIITNWMFCKYFYLTYCDNPSRCIASFVGIYKRPDYTLL